MAVVRNKTPDDLSLLDGASVKADAELDVPDETFVDRAWPKSTWAIVKKPSLTGYRDQSTDDAYLWSDGPEPTWLDGWAADHPHGDGRMADPGAFTVEQVLEYVANVDDVERARVIALETDGKARKGIIEGNEG